MVDFASVVTDPSRDIWGDVLAVPEDYRPFAAHFAGAIDAVRSGARCEIAGPVRSFGLLGEIEAPGGPIFVSELGGRMISEGLLKLEYGREDEALDVLLALHRAGGDCFSGGTSIDMGLGAGMLRRVIHVLSCAVAISRISEEGVRRIEAALLLELPDPKASRRLLEASWVMLQWDIARWLDGGEKLRLPGDRIPGPFDIYLPDRRDEFIEGWAWLRTFELEMDRTQTIRTTSDLRRIGALVVSRAAEEGPVIRDLADWHGSIYRRVADFCDLRIELLNQLRANITLRRRRDGGEADPKDIRDLLPPGCPATTTQGPFCWWLHPDPETTWVGIAHPGRQAR